MEVSHAKWSHAHEMKQCPWRLSRKGLVLGLWFVFCLGMGLPVSAEYWMSNSAVLLKNARRVEVVQIDQENKSSWEATVLSSVRGEPVGKKIQIARPWDSPSFAPQDKMLLICDDSLCPRAVGLDRGDHFVLRAFQPGDGAHVLPGMVETKALAPLAKGTRAPELCVEAVLTFLDEPGVRLPMRGTFQAAHGSGTIQVPSLQKGPYRGSLSQGGFDSSWPESTAITLHDGKREGVLLQGGPLRRVSGGCFQTEVTPTRPLVRTRKGLQKALQGVQKQRLIARGTLEIASGHSVPGGAYPVRVYDTPTYGLRVEVSLLPDGKVSWINQTQPGTMTLGFTTQPQNFYPLLLLPIPQQGPRHTNAVEVLASSLRRHPGKQVSWPALWSRSTAKQGVKQQTVGSWKLQYVPEGVP